MPRNQKPSQSRSAKDTAQIQRKIQSQQQANNSGDKADGQKVEKSHAPGPGHDVPIPPMLSQPLVKPGLEGAMITKPLYMASDYKGSGKLEGKIAIITGGDSGIGRAVAVLFAREGADVAILYLNEDDDAKETCDAIEKEGRRSLAISGDVQDQKFCDNAIKQVLEKFGSINLLINNAAFQEHASAIEDLTDERIEQTFRTNVLGYFHMVKSTLPYLHEGDAIINTGSVTGLRGSKHLLDYSATKGAIHAFTKSLAQNLMDKGIRVNAVAPGPVWTPLNPADRPAQEIRDFGADTEMGRPAQPEELAPAYVFLASQVCSSYISGIVLPITGSVAE